MAFQGRELPPPPPPLSPLPPPAAEAEIPPPPAAAPPTPVRCTNPSCGCWREDTPAMREGPLGHGTLCNACGLYWKKTGQLRDIALLENKGRGAKRRREYLAGLPQAPEAPRPGRPLPADQAQAMAALAAAASAAGEVARSGPARAAPPAVHAPVPRHTFSGGGSPQSSSPREALARLLSLSPPPLSPQQEPPLRPAPTAAPGGSPAARPRPGQASLEEQRALLELLLAAEAGGGSPTPAKRQRPGGLLSGQQGTAGAALRPMGPLARQLPIAGHGATSHLLGATLTGTPPAKLAALPHLISEEERQQHVQVVVAWLAQHGQQAQRSQQLPHAGHSLGSRRSAFHPFVSGGQQAPALASPRGKAGANIAAPPLLQTQQGGQAELAGALRTLGVQLAPAQQEALAAGLRRLGPPAASLLPAGQQLADSVPGPSRPHQPGNGFSAWRQPAVHPLLAPPPGQSTASSMPTSPGAASPPAVAFSPAAGGAAVHAGRPLTALPPGASLALASAPTWRSGAPAATSAAALQQPQAPPPSPSAALKAVLALRPPPLPPAALCTDAAGLLAALQMCSTALPGLQQAQH